MAQVSLEDIKPNSNAYRTQQKEKDGTKNPISPVVKRENIVSTKKPLSQKAAELFFGDDVDSLGGYVVREIVVPSLKNTFLDVMESIFMGGTRRNRGRGYGYSDGGYDYGYPYRTRSVYGGRDSSRRDSYRDRDRDDRYEERDKRVDYRNIVVRYREDAEEIIDRMREAIDLYNQVSIAELYRLVDLPSAYTDNNWGWTDPRDIGIKRVSSGYLIDVAEARYLE